MKKDLIQIHDLNKNKGLEYLESFGKFQKKGINPRKKNPINFMSEKSVKGYFASSYLLVSNFLHFQCFIFTFNNSRSFSKRTRQTGYIR